MTIQLSLLLYIYYAFLALWGLLALAAVYHMVKYGFKNLVTIFATGLFIAVSIWQLAVAYGLLSPIDWSAELVSFESPATWLKP